MQVHAAYTIAARAPGLRRAPVEAPEALLAREVANLCSTQGRVGGQDMSKRDNTKGSVKRNAGKLCVLRVF